MGNSSSINANHADRPPDEIFQVLHLLLNRKFSMSLKLTLNLASDGQIKVSNAGNTCYMDAVLFSMFAMPSPVLDAMLTKR